MKDMVEYIKQNNVATIQDLCDRFQVSKPTVNRDLGILEQKKLIVRVYGGAMMTKTGTSFEPSQFDKEQRCIDQKRAIARKAKSLINEGDTILIDSGTTTLQLAKALLDFSNITVITNDLAVANVLCENDKINLIVVGGIRRPHVYSLVGPIAEDILQGLNVDKLFMGVDAIDDVRGIMNSNIEEYSAKRSMVRIAKQVIVLCDSSKFGKAALKKVCDCSDVDIIISDDGLLDIHMNKFVKLGIKVYRMPSADGDKEAVQ